MTEKPIPFKPLMVRAILDGRQTQTRRVLKWQPVLQDGKWLWTSGTMGFHAYEVGSDGFWACKPTHVVGDRLWVQESFAIVSFGGAVADGIFYKADVDRTHRFLTLGGTWETRKDGQFHSRPDKWKPSIHMRRWASRLTLLVTDVRVQRLHDISEEDARAEGITPQPYHPGRWISEHDKGWSFKSARVAFEHLWKSLNGDDSWNANPWVAAYTFEVLP